MSNQASFELLRKRLQAGAAQLKQKSDQLNAERLKLFGRIEPKQIARLSARTDNNCVARDVVRAGSLLLLGYNVFMGLKRELQISDMFALYRLGETDATELTPVPIAGSFLAEPRFAADFKELLTYYKQTTLDQLRVINDRLLLIFRTGSNSSDKRVFRFALARDGALSYLDNRGERDHVLPPTHDFEWQQATRDMHVAGRHPHINILDTVFVETIGGDLTLKVENNTDSGLGIFSEPVIDKTQALADAEIYFANLKHQIVLKIKPYREPEFRYLLYNKRLRSVARIDELGLSAAQLPEDHGLVFPGGYALESGETKRFSEIGQDFSRYKLKRILKAPNGEDVLYVFYAEQAGEYALLPYNLIDRSAGAPIFGSGYARFSDGRILVFVPESNEAARLHTMQLWRTPFADADFDFEHGKDKFKAGKQAQNLLSRTGNATLVRALADLRLLIQIANDAKSLADYERLLKLGQKCADAYTWLAEPEAFALRDDVLSLSRTGKAALEAFAQLNALKQRAAQEIARVATSTRELLSKVAGFLWQKPDDFTEAIRSLKRKRGDVLALSELPHVDKALLLPIEQQLKDEQLRIGERAIKFFSEPAAFQSLQSGLQKAGAELLAVKSSAMLKPIETHLDELAESLEGLTELITGFEQSDPLARAKLLESTSKLFSEVNRLRAGAGNLRAELLTRELSAEFQAQLTVFEQAQFSALGRAISIAGIDEAQARLLNQLNELDGKFGAQAQFSEALTSRRESLLEALGSRREQLRAERDVRVQSLKTGVLRVFESLPKRLLKLTNMGDLQAFFASDPLIDRARTQIEQLRQLDEAVLADELSGRLKSAKEAALRDLRDRAELGVDGQSLKLGKHRFTVANRQIELAIVHEPNGLALVISGTDYRRAIAIDGAERFSALAGQTLVSESTEVYRAETLAYLCLSQQIAAAPALSFEARLEQVARFAAERPAEDYQRGIHDFDAATILAAIAPKLALAGELMVPASSRVLAMCWVSQQLSNRLDDIKSLCHARMLLLQANPKAALLLSEIEMTALHALAAELGFDARCVPACAQHVVRVLGSDAEFPVFGAAQDAALHLENALPKALLASLRAARTGLRERLNTLTDLVQTQLALPFDTALEAAAIVLLAPACKRVNAELELEVPGLLGQHGRIVNAKLAIRLPEFNARLRYFVDVTMPLFREYAAAKHQLLEARRSLLNLSQFEAKPMAGFVRNRLIDELYLPLIGNNLAKQIGTLEDQRPDRSGLLLLISPPGYGKTTLMEYLADRLGMIFVRINGPTLGHEVTSLDPSQCSHKGAVEELEKLNLGLMMGNNVMLYLDDIQHLNPEFLQKFISLSDATRRIDAIDQGQARSLDLRGKRFAIVMAGNPYTESGEVFRIPDMLANRADVYNLGDVLSGREALFNDSYLENAMTSNSLTAAISELGRDAVLSAITIAGGGEAVLPSELRQAGDAIEVLKRMIDVRAVLSKVNAAYVGSAAQDDAYRTEPPFKLQGSYRNMIKLTAQLSPLMTPSELRDLIADHYRGEAQTLGARAEENLLKLAQLSGALTDVQAQRWESLCDSFRRLLLQGGKNSDGATKVANLLSEIAVQLEKQRDQPALKHAASVLESLRGDFAAFAKRPEPKAATLNANVAARLDTPATFNTAFERLVKSYEETLVPLVSAMHHKMTLDHATWDHVRNIRTDLDAILKRTGGQVAKAKPKTTDEGF